MCICKSCVVGDSRYRFEFVVLLLVSLCVVAHIICIKMKKTKKKINIPFLLKERRKYVRSVFTFFFLAIYAFISTCRILTMYVFELNNNNNKDGKMNMGHNCI